MSVGTVFTVAKTALTGGVEFDSSGRLRAQSAGGGLFQLDTQNNSAALPTYTFRGDGDTGMWWPGANTVAWSTNGSERMRITSSGNVGIGNSASNAKLEVSATSGEVFRADAAGGAYRILATQTGVNLNGNVGIGTTSPSSDSLSVDKGSIRIRNATGFLSFSDAGSDATEMYIQRSTSGQQMALVSAGPASNGFITFKTGGTAERLRIDSSGRVLIAHDTAIAGDRLELTANGDGSAFGLFGRASDGNSSIRFRANNAATEYARLQASNTNALSFHTGSSGTQRAVIDSSGNLLVGRTSTGAAATDYGTELYSTGTLVQYTNTSGTTNGYAMYDSAGAVVVAHRGNGGIANFQANDTNLSDERAKKDIVDSSDYLDRLCQIPVRNFRYKHDDAEGKHHLGVIAQEVEAACPELVSKESWEYEGEQLDSVHSSDLMYAMLKAIQELKAKVEALENA